MNLSGKEHDGSGKDDSGLPDEAGCPSVEVNTRQELIDKLQEGLEDVRNGDVRPFDEAMEEILSENLR